MHIFLTSSPTGDLDGSRPVKGIDSFNQFLYNLKKLWKHSYRCAYICADFKSYDSNDEAVQFFKKAFQDSNLFFSCFDCIDDRNHEKLDYDVILLGGGHVPSQNQYFKDYKIKEKLKEFDGILIGISAGSMNCANIVYAMPEEAGESINPGYQRFLTGLGYTDTQILPHYQMLKESVLDGKRLFEDIVYPDSYNHSFLCLVDGSYVYIHDGIETVYGLSYKIQDGRLVLFCDHNEHRILKICE